METRQVVIKGLESHFRAIPGISGGAILGDGSVCLILDIYGLDRLIFGD
jgi:two-component system chemotaxis sensor kinase CheA